MSSNQRFMMKPSLGGRLAEVGSSASASAWKG